MVMRQDGQVRPLRARLTYEIRAERTSRCSCSGLCFGDRQVGLTITVKVSGRPADISERPERRRRRGHLAEKARHNIDCRRDCKNQQPILASTAAVHLIAEPRANNLPSAGSLESEKLYQKI